MKKWFVRCEIIGEFVIKEEFGTEKEARAYMEEKKAEGIWHQIDIYEV